VSKIVQIGAVVLKIWAMQWAFLILQVKNWVDFIARRRHWRYKFIQYRANRCVQNQTILKCTKNHANQFRRF